MKVLLSLNLITVIRFIILFIAVKNIFSAAKWNIKKNFYNLIKKSKFLLINFFCKKYKILKNTNTVYRLCLNEAVVCSSFNQW